MHKHYDHPFTTKIAHLIIFFCFLLNISVQADVTYSTDTTLNASLRLQGQSSFVTFNGNLTLNGAGYWCIMPNPSGQTMGVFIVNAGFTVTCINILFKEFWDANLNLGTGSSIIFGDNTIIQIHTDQTLTNTYNFAGTSILQGERNRINMGTGRILVNPGSNLTIANVTLNNVSATNLGCADNTGSIKFENVNISTNTWNWNNGSFAVSNNVEIMDGTFVYTSAMSSTILANSQLRFSNNLTFSYDPVILSGQTKANPLNLTFTNTSSWLSLNSCSLYITTTGMQLLKGSLEVIGKNNLYSDATPTTGLGLIFGDGITYANDFRIQNFNSYLSSIDIKKGVLIYKNKES
jgi:hypothetical protein